jgi:hypothetical protein
MSFAQEQGYIPATIADLMDLVREGVNEQFATDYDAETFEGTNLYKYFYALIQRLQENEVKTSEIVLKLQQYFDVTNEKITRPNTTHPGLLDYLTALGYRASTKPPADADAGKVYVCVDLTGAEDDYAAKKLEICTAIRDCVPAGIISQGAQVETIALSNDQSFDFKFALPDRIPILLKLTLTVSDNNQTTILSDDDVRALLIANIAARYRLGLDFEPQRYFSVLDAPWCAAVLLEWSEDAGANWYSTVSDLDFDELYEFDEGDITIVSA